MHITCIYAYIHTYVRICTYTQLSYSSVEPYGRTFGRNTRRPDIYVNSHIHIYTYVYINMQVCIHICVYIYMCIYLYVFIHVYIYICIYIYI